MFELPSSIPPTKPPLRKALSFAVPLLTSTIVILMLLSLKFSTTIASAALSSEAPVELAAATLAKEQSPYTSMPVGVFSIPTKSTTPTSKTLSSSSSYLLSSSLSLLYLLSLSSYQLTNRINEFLPKR